MPPGLPRPNPIRVAARRVRLGLLILLLSALLLLTGAAAAAPQIARAQAPTPPPPPIFAPANLRAGVQPQDYLTDPCEYLRRRWDPALSTPGTIVAPFMFHSVVRAGKTVQEGDATSITAASLADFMEHARALGFQTITTDQLVNFLESNAKIPPRSMILIVDDRRPGVVREHFLPYLNNYNWTVTLGYISGLANAAEWQQFEDLYATGRVDPQVHGFLHNGSTYFVPETPEATVLREIYAPMPLFRQHFGDWPVAFIWPGGNFTPRAVQVARQAHYHLGFTAFARGPLFYNWVPLGPEERAIGDPLMTLPRYWSTAAYPNLDEAVQLAGQASAFAEQQKPAEQAYLQQYCPAPAP